MRPSAAMRAAILEGQAVPLSRLSSAFLEAKTQQDVQLAYLESALAVEFLVEKAGFPALRGLLEDLGSGKNLDEALPARAGTTLQQLDAEFAAFARGKAEAGATWEPLELPEDADSAALAAWVQAHPKNHPGWRRYAARLVSEGKWPEAEAALPEYRALDPEYVGEENAYMLLAEVHRRKGDAAAERAALEELASRDGDATSVFQRLVDLAAAADWEAVARNARRLLDVNPLVPAPYRSLADAAERLGRPEEAVAACRALAALDDADPAGVHHRLARLLAAVGRRDEARREALKALEDAPRFLDAHRLLLELVEAP
jgi:tetratricopeptide (TPR) repeat protein